MTASPQWTYAVGAGSAAITPPLELGILMGRGRWRPFEAVRRGLRVRALVIECPAERTGRIVIVSLELLGLADEVVGGFDRFARKVLSAGAVAVQSGHSVDMNQRTRTTRPRSDESASASLFCQSSVVHSLGVTPTSS